MAFSKSLEEVIEAALADGVITEKERAVLHKKAQQEGVDPDEIDVVIDGRLAKMKREVDWLRPEPPRSIKHGNVVECPSCGAQVIGGTAVCPECGYTFSNISANSSVEKLQKKLSEFNQHQEKRADNRTATNPIIQNMFGGEYQRTLSTLNHKMDIVKNFPVPNTRADLLEFLTMIQPMADITGSRQGGLATGEEDLSYAYWLLYSNCINKARLSFSKDSDFSPYFAFYEQEIKKSKGIIGYLKSNPRTQIGLIGIVLIIIAFGLLAIIA